MNEAGIAERDEPAVGAPEDRAAQAPVWRWDLLVFVLAVAARLFTVFRLGGSRGTFGYDAGVYFTASDALLHGRLPYRNFTQLHPPMIDLALTPITALTHLFSDHTSFFIGVVAFTVLGGVNAVLTRRVCLRLGLGGAGSVVGGLVYALWYGSIEAEYLIKLEPLGNFFLLLALLFALRADGPQLRLRPAVLAGVALGLAVSTKIWWILPAVAIIVWLGARHRSARPAGAALGGMLAAVVVVNLPFFVAAPKQMWHMVVIAQLGRPRRHSLAHRILDITTLPRLVHTSHTVSLAVAGLTAVMLLAVLAAALRVRAAWPAVGLLVLQLLILLAGPSWYPYYCDFLTVGLALTVAGAAASLRERAVARTHRPRIVGPVVAAGMAVLTAAILIVDNIAVKPFPGGPQLARAVRNVRCVTSDSPVALIELDALSRGLADGCSNPVDIEGTRFSTYRSKQVILRNTKYQNAMLRHLFTGRAIIILEPREEGITPAMLRSIAAHGLLAQVSYNRVYRGPGRG
ncbi:hypothetical protein [uncultured Jatrophihabitans sp.]|uniref:hypothetical protein n=1 Tax=uncultured Jatrophihabitans sp. TaxID=1610747 RepID=UPI0035C9A1C0